MSDYRNIRAVIVENNPMMRRDLRAALTAKGARDVAVCWNMGRLLETLENEVLDLILCDADLLGPDFTPMMQSIRNNSLGRNPFVVAVATMHDASETKVRRVLNGGVDDLICKPTPINTVIDRVVHLVHARKPFVATEDYVGPTRRKYVRTGDDRTSLVTVPNTLYSKVEENASESELLKQIADAAVRVEEKKTKNPQSGIDRLIRRSLDAYENGGFNQDLRKDFEYLVDISEDVAKRYRGTEHNHIADLAVALAQLAKRIAQNDKPPQRADIEILANLGEVIRRSIAAQKQMAKAG